MEDLRRELERFITPGLARYALSEAARIDDLLRELGTLERRYHTLARAWPLRWTLTAEGDGPVLLEPGTALVCAPADDAYETDAAVAELLLAALEEYSGHLLAWGGGVLVAFFPETGSDAHIFRACLTTEQLIEELDSAPRVTIAGGKGGLFILEALGRYLALPAGQAVEDALRLLAHTPAGRAYLSRELAEVVSERFQVRREEGYFSLGSKERGRRVMPAQVDDPIPEPPERLLDRLSRAAAGMERARPWLAPWQLIPLGSRHQGERRLAVEGVLALGWPGPRGLVEEGLDEAQGRLRVEAEICANWGGELWGAVPHEGGLATLYVFAEPSAAAGAGYAVLSEFSDRSGGLAAGPLSDYYLRGAHSSVVVPAGEPLLRAVRSAVLAPAGTLVCPPEDAPAAEPDFEEEREIAVADRRLCILVPSHAREEAGQPLLGLEKILARADVWLEELRQGRPVVGVVTGEPGSGKSRLASELCDLFAELGDAHLFRAQPWWSYDPYGLWRRMLLAVWGPVSSSAAAEAQRRALGEAAPRLAEFIALFTGGKLSEPLWGLTPGEKGEMAGELLLAAIEARGGRPLTVVVDDAECLDPGSVSLIRSLTGAGPPLAVILCGNEAPKGTQAPAVAIEPLPPAEAEGLFKTLSGRDAGALGPVSERELLPGRLTYLALLAGRDRLTTLHARLPLDRLAAELFALETDPGALETVSVLGPRFSAGDLAAVSDDVSPLRARLAECSLVIREGGEYAFAGQAAWRAAYAAVDPGRRRELHFNAARFYQRQHGGVVAQAVNHFMNCGDPAERITALELAGQLAAEVGSFDAAISYYADAVEAAPDRRAVRRLRAGLAGILASERRFGDAGAILVELYDQAEEGEEAERAELALQNASIHCARGEPDEVEFWTGRSAACDPEGRWDARRELLLGETALRINKREEALGHLERAGADEGRDGARARALLGKTLLELGRPDEAYGPLASVLEWAEATGHLSLAAEAQQGLAEIYQNRREATKALEALEAALARERSLLQAGQVAETQARLGELYLEHGRGPEAESSLREAERTFERLGNETRRAAVRQERALVLTNLGRLAEAREITEELLRVRVGKRDRFGTARLSCELGRLADYLGDWTAAARHLDAALVGAKELGDAELLKKARLAYADTLLGRGETAEGLEALREAGDEEETDHRTAEFYRSLHLFAEAAALHSKALARGDGADPRLRLALSLDRLASGDTSAGRKAVEGVEWPKRPDHELTLNRLWARALHETGLGRKVTEACRDYRERAEASGDLRHRLRAARLSADVDSISGDAERARAILDEALAYPEVPAITWQLHFLAGLLAGRAGDNEGKRAHFKRALAALERLAAGLPDKRLKSRLLAGDPAQILRRG
ncbi:MAG TPA: AAA family ATPase [bacterium]|nr:AAA family ATPase [bacterium]